METIDEEVTEHAVAFIDRCHKDGKPFFPWYNTTAMHFRTHSAEKHKGKSGQGDYNDVMVVHDENIGRMLAKLDELGIADDTIVMYSTDNGPHYNSGPMARSPRSAAKRTPIGRAAGGFRSSCAGPAWCRGMPRSTTSSWRRIGS
jgi:arylsulfatase A-like enzyme